MLSVLSRRPRSPAEAAIAIHGALTSHAPTLHQRAAQLVARFAVARARPATIVIDANVTAAAWAFARVAGADWNDVAVRERCQTLAHRAARVLLSEFDETPALDAHVLTAIAVAAVDTLPTPADVADFPAWEARAC